MSLESVTELFDRQQAFAVGFALAARDNGLDAEDHALMCKIAAEKEWVKPWEVKEEPKEEVKVEPKVEEKVQPIKADNKKVEKKVKPGKPLFGKKAATLLTLLKLNAAAQAPIVQPTPGQAGDVKAQNFISQKVQALKPQAPTKTAAATLVALLKLNASATTAALPPAASATAPANVPLNYQTTPERAGVQVTDPAILAQNAKDFEAAKAATKAKTMPAPSATSATVPSPGSLSPELYKALTK